jgi:VirB8 protein
MIRKIERNWFEIWGTEEAQNRMLKGLLAFVLCLLAVETIALVFLSVRRPLVIAVSSEATKVLTASPPQPEVLQNEVKRVVTSYINQRHSWDWSNIENNINAAAKLVGKNYSRKFISATSDQIRLAKNKRLSQRFYISNIAIDEKARIARVTGDRVLVIDTLRAVNPMTLEIGYEVSDRTADNPEGVYVISEANLTK